MPKAITLVICALLAVSAVSASAGQDDLSASSLRIEWTEFKQLYDAKKVVVVDVRGEDAYAAGHIPGARSIPLDAIEKRAPELKKLDTPVVLYCA